MQLSAFASASLFSLLAFVPDAATIAQARPIFARVSGTVFDSIAMRPLAGAIVRVVRTDDPSIGRTAVSDTAGRFAYDSVPVGIWMASFLHPKLDSLRLEPGIVRLDISASDSVTMLLATPSARTLIVASCGALPLEFGLIIGEVRRAEDDAPMTDATVEVEWPEWVLQKRNLITEQQRQSARTDSLGRYTLCGAPTGSTMRAVSWSGSDTTGVVEVEVPAAGVALLDFAVGSVIYITAADSSTVSSRIAERIRRGTATVRGRVTTTDDRPLANAVVRVIGSGSQVRVSGDGAFAITDAGAGTQTIEARALGFRPYRRVVRLYSSRATETTLSLAVANVQLDTVRVVAGREVPWDVRGIERRWRTGLGKFIDGATVRERTATRTTDALRRVAGVTVRQEPGADGQQIIMRSNTGVECLAILFVDGIPIDVAGSGEITIDQLARPDMVAAIEVYSRPSMAPAEYLTMARDCGVVALWTKAGTHNVPVLPPKSDRK